MTRRRIRLVLMVLALGLSASVHAFMPDEARHVRRERIMEIDQTLVRLANDLRDSAVSDAGRQSILILRAMLVEERAQLVLQQRMTGERRDLVLYER